MEALLIVLDVKYKPSARLADVPGVLTMTENSFSFTPSCPGTFPVLDADLRTIKAYKYSKDGSKEALLKLIRDPVDKEAEFIFKFESVGDRNACRDLVCKILGKYQYESQLPNAGQPMTEAEIIQKMKLLQKDSELLKQHHELVIGNVLTVDQFWGKHKHLLDEEASKIAKQNH